MPRRPVLILVLALALGLTSARAQEPYPTPGSETGPVAASQLVLAERLFRMATRTGDPVLLLAAIRLARGVTQRPAVGWDRTTAPEAGIPTGDGLPDPASAAALTMLQGLAADDPDLQDMVYDLDAQLPTGRLPVATVAISGLGGGAEEVWRVPLSGSVAAEIAVIGAPEISLGLTVTDDSGTVVCARPATTDPALCRFVPSRNGFFSVRVGNAGEASGGYRLIGN